LRRRARRPSRYLGTALTLYLPDPLIIASYISLFKSGSERRHGSVTKPSGEEGKLGMRVLLIEDDRATAQSIELLLKSQSFNVYTTDLGEEGVDLGKIYDYDIILLDLNLPDISGFEVMRSLRVSKVKTPILILSGLPGIEDKVRGLGFGADDYMTKPFHRDELVARIHAIVRRSKGHAQSVIQTGDLVVNLDTKTVEVNGARVHLTGKEYQMLELLSLRKGMTLTKEMFLNHLYGGIDEPEVKIIDVFMCKLRKKLASNDYIETVWGRGYLLRDPAGIGAKIPA
jgi:two-component system cell cycle response regulator CtrA